ncbi:helix-turn-helix transcriptional regulator [Robertkochia aurantiaca]|uniref:helix-turn-helix transcriptional regulator n=1 Tax=Robertkochia aurantiaca TaxID=2873700 RepID=UPI001CCB9C93|nr:helix-turn-helix transcriptional regulator [Robertkochia sp. 3YJGBD-33]
MALRKKEEVLSFWKEHYSQHVSQYQRFQISDQLKRFSALFAPGNCYFYVLNLHNLELDYVSPEVKIFTGMDPEEVSMKDILKTSPEEEMEMVHLKEQVIQDFFHRFLGREHRLDYKLVYVYQAIDAQGHRRTMLHQASILNLNDEGLVEHALSVHSDISYLKIPQLQTVSFIHLKGGKSYHNIPVNEGRFIPPEENKEADPAPYNMSKREKEILGYLIKGYTTEQISERLFLSTHTVKTHRRNMLQKSGFKNTPELIADVLMHGWLN